MTDKLLVTTDWLADHLDDPDLRIVDIRGHVIPASEPPPHYFNHREDYEKSHIPGAVFVDWVHEITDPESYLHARIAPPQRYADVMSRLGIEPDTFVVAYDDAQGAFAARLWWSLNYYGHSQVAVLDGGWNQWIAEGRPTSAELPTIEPAVFVANPNPNWIRSGDQVFSILNTATRIIDTRSPEEFAGETSRIERKGHIPGAVNIPRLQLVGEDGTFRSPETLRQLFLEAGVDGSSEIVTYCNAGVSASYGLLTLKIAGFDGAMYDGSWKDWGSNANRPVET